MWVHTVGCKVIDRMSSVDNWTSEQPEERRSSTKDISSDQSVNPVHPRQLYSDLLDTLRFQPAQQVGSLLKPSGLKAIYRVSLTELHPYYTPEKEGILS